MDPSQYLVRGVGKGILLASDLCPDCSERPSSPTGAVVIARTREGRSSLIMWCSFGGRVSTVSNYNGRGGEIPSEEVKKQSRLVKSRPWR